MTTKSVKALRALVEEKDKQIEDLKNRINCMKKDMNTAAVTLRKMYGVWGEAPDDLCSGEDTSRETWRQEVANEETSQGYWSWVAYKMEEHGH